MKILLDTSVLVAAMVEAHPAHERALHWMQKIKAGTDVGFKDFVRIYPDIADNIILP